MTAHSETPGIPLRHLECAAVNETRIGAVRDALSSEAHKRMSAARSDDLPASLFGRLAHDYDSKSDGKSPPTKERPQRRSLSSRQTTSPPWPENSQRPTARFPCPVCGASPTTVRTRSVQRSPRTNAAHKMCCNL